MTTDDNMDVADVLDAAADYIRTHGFMRGGYGGCGGPACAIGAILEVTDQNIFGSAGAALSSLQGFLYKEYGHEAAYEWNDAPERTADEVIDALMEAAARVRTGEVQP